MSMIFHQLVAPEIVMMTTCGSASDEKFVNMTVSKFQFNELSEFHEKKNHSKVLVVHLFHYLCPT